MIVSLGVRLLFYCGMYIITRSALVWRNFLCFFCELNSKFKYDYYYSGKTYNLDDMYIQNSEIAENIFMYLRNLDSGVNTGSSLPIKATCAIILGDMQVIFGFQTPVYYRHMWGDWSEWKTI